MGRQVCKLIYPEGIKFISLSGNGKYNCPTLEVPNGSYNTYYSGNIIGVNLDKGEDFFVRTSDKEYLFLPNKDFDPDLYCIVRNRGGLGNQLFNYSYALWLTNQYNIKVHLARCDERERIDQLDNFCLSDKVSYCTKIEKKCFEKFGNTVNSSPPTIKHKILQSYTVPIKFKWICGNEEKLRKVFTLTKSLDEANLRFLNEIQSSENSVLIHIRRGDYEHPKNTSIYARLEYTNYYDKAIPLIKSMFKNPKFFVFSEDSKFVRNMFVKKYSDTDFTYVDCNIDDQRKAAFELELMKNCKHFIIANSTLSYWAAFLNDNPDKIVIAPTFWSTVDEINDLLDPSWIRV